MKKTLSIVTVLFVLLVSISPLSAFAYDEFDFSSYTLNSAAQYVVNIESGRVVVDNGGEQMRSIASLTKIMTAIVTLENCSDLQQSVTVNKSALQSIAGTGLVVANLQESETLSVENLLYCLLLPSAADAAMVLAEHIGGSIDGFVAMMNQKAEELKLKNTHFVDPHGLHDMADGHYSTAKDVATLCKYALKNKTFAKIVSTAEYTVPATNASGERKLESTNKLIGADAHLHYDLTKGIKTGYTKLAGRCLASVSSNGKESYICVVLGADGYTTEGLPAEKHFTDSIYLLENANKDYSLQTATVKENVLGTIPVKCFGIRTDVLLAAERDFEYLLKDGEEFSFELQKDSELLKQPVEAGQKLGSLTVKIGDKKIKTIDLVAQTAVERSMLRMTVTVLIYVLIAAAGVVVLLLIRNVLKNKKKKVVKTK